MRNAVRIYKRKYDGTLKREVAGDLVEVAGEGWLLVYYDASRHESLKNGSTTDSPPRMLACLSTVSPLVWWLFYDEIGRLTRAHADSALPATISGRAITFVDLDLDLIVAPDFLHFARDFDALAANAEAMSYPAHVVNAAHEGLRLARKAVDERAFPFDGSAERVLGRVLASDGPL
jgi:hypothetical protein